MRFKLLVLLIFASVLVYGQSSSTWIWYPGDWDIWLSGKAQIQRVERDFVIPPFWRLDSHYPLISFHKQVVLEDEEVINIAAEGQYNVSVNGIYKQGDLSKIKLPKGKNDIKILVYNLTSPPSVWVAGKTVFSDKSWLVTAQDHKYLNADSWKFDKINKKPSQFKLEVEEQKAANVSKNGKGILIDYGKETMGFLKFKNLSGHGRLNIFYGESKEEALDTAFTETLDRFNLDLQLSKDWITPISRGFRYVYIPNTELNFEEVSLMYEYLPVEHRGKFTSSDTLLNRIWNVSAYTLHLSTREFFLDGIKRDRWIWSGDAIQSYLMNYYLFFDSPSVKRTVRALRGKDPVPTHINTIMDYSFYWFMSIYDYYMYSGDKEFVKQMYPQMLSLMEYCLNRRNKDGFMEGMAGDWVFLDWAPMTKEGELSAEQILFCRSLQIMAICAEIMDDTENKLTYQLLFEDLKKNIFNVFWDEQQGLFWHSRMGGILDKNITKYANMFALMFGYLDNQQSDSVKSNVLMNDEVQKITTPYMRFYELEALCKIGEYNTVIEEMREYWGGMLNLGATSFWETYDPKEEGRQHLAMYGRPYGKSLCHAWGASPIYILGRYFIGVEPIEEGYKKYTINPQLADLDWFSGTVPTENGEITVFMDKNSIKVESTIPGVGLLKFRSLKKPKVNIGKLNQAQEDYYEIEILPNKGYEILY